MRTENSIKNVISTFGYNILVYVLRFVSRIIFVMVLSDVYLGVNSLLANVLGILALTELGIGTAISFSLYKPLSEQDNFKIKGLMKFYKSAYRVIALIVLILGIVLLPFLPYLIKDTSGIENLSIIYLIFLFNMVITYLFSYKRTLIQADQKNYKIMPIIMTFTIITTLIQILILCLFKDYIAYLIVQSVTIIIENIVVNHYIDKQYPILKKITKEDKIEKKDLKTITTNVKALMLHKIGAYVLTGTDSIIISKFIGIVAVGVYANYILITNMLYSFINVFMNNVTSSLGNLIAKEDKKKSYQVFQEMNFICFVLFAICSVCMLTVFNPFIELTFGAKFVLPIGTVVLITICFFITGITNVPITIQSAAGLYDNDKFVPLIQAGLNIVLSIFMAIKWGIAGVVLGTIISYFLPLIIKPTIIYRHVFKKSVLYYFIDFMKQLLVIAIASLIACLIASSFINLSLLIQVLLNGLISMIIILLLIIIIYHKSTPYNDVKARIRFIINKKRGVK